MYRFWGLLFFAVPIVGTIVYALAMLGVAPFAGLRLPANYNQAGVEIDHLYNVIHGIMAVVFVSTGLLLGWSVWRFGGRQLSGGQELGARYFTHSNLLELTWSVAAAGILVFLSLYQLNSWAENKLERPLVEIAGRMQPQPPLAKVVAKRFGWEFYHAGPDGRLDTPDDVYLENLLHVPFGEPVVLQLESRDVIHSFFVPGLRLKQDIVPGMQHFVWFKATSPVELEIICSELCGWGHYTMQARMQLVSRSDYDRWLAEQSPWKGFAAKEEQE
ncbi:MAG: cytochrome c oxidase subunit II [Planctomycetota bacterium]|jgi:cytochrome c oxidase subunit 2